MSLIANRDLDALQLGFIADGVLRALRLAAQGPPDEESRRRLREAGAMLSAIAAGVGASAPAPGLVSGFSAFAYAADALRASGTGTLPEGVRNHFGRLAVALGTLADGNPAEPESVEGARSFFKALSSATLENWSGSQPPGPGLERTRWAAS